MCRSPHHLSSICALHLNINNNNISDSWQRANKTTKKNKKMRNTIGGFCSKEEKKIKIQIHHWMIVQQHRKFHRARWRGRQWNGFLCIVAFQFPIQYQREFYIVFSLFISFSFACTISRSCFRFGHFSPSPSAHHFVVVIFFVCCLVLFQLRLAFCYYYYYCCCCCCWFGQSNCVVASDINRNAVNFTNSLHESTTFPTEFLLNHVFFS